MKTQNKLTFLFTLLLIVILVAACTSSGSSSEEDTANEEATAEHNDEDDHAEGEEHDEEHAEGEEHDDSIAHDRIPNENGAAIHIVSPSDGEVFKHGDQIIVEVETENFDISQEGNHWHVFVDGNSWGMIMGGNTDAPLSGVEPGEHEISVYLSIPTHEEYEDGDAIQITVEE
jgi:hypothetical protein